MEKVETVWRFTNCGACYGSCGIKVRVQDGVITRIAGVEESDNGSRGGVCGKGGAMLMSFYDPNRCNYPVKRTNPKKGLHEDPGWERISWEEALDTIAEKLKKVKDKDPKELLSAGTPSPGTCLTWGVGFVSLWIAFGSTNIAPGGVGSHCGNSAHMGAGLFHASWDMCPDFRYCNYSLQFGSNQGTASGHSAGVMMNRKAEARARGMKEIVFDPICNFAGGKASEWYPILPGTDSAVILALCNLIVNDIGIYDVDFVKHKTNGPYLVGPGGTFIRDKENSDCWTYDSKPLIWDANDGKAKTYDDPTLKDPTVEGEYEVNGIKCRPAFHLLKEHLRQYDPKWASEISAVPENVIRRIAHEWVTESRIGSTIEIEGVKLPYRPVAAGMYRGAQGHNNGFHQFMSVCLLNTLAGNLDIPGGAVGWPARGLGYPGTNRSRYEPYAGFEGMLTPDNWFAHNPWPPEKPRWPENVCLKELFTHQTSPPYPYARDFEEIWEKVGRPREVKAMAIYGVNLAKSNANPELMERFLKKVPFIFSVNTVHNETTEGFADIVLPDCHFLESLDVFASMAYMFNYPPGMDDWCFHLRMPAVEPEYERRSNLDIMFDLADRLGIRATYNNILDAFVSTRKMVLEPRHDPIGAARDAKAREEGNLVIRPDESISSEEFVKRAVKVLFGKEHDLEWFKQNGFIRWKKRVEEAHWRPFINARVPVYFEFLAHEKELVRDIGEKIGLHADWERLTPLISWFPPRTSTKVASDSAFDMTVFSYRDILHCGTWTVGNPWLDEMSRMNPYSYNITMHQETAKEKGLKEGDMICLESPEGYKTTGRLKLMNGIHPKTIGMSGHTGSWAKGLPVGKNKGPYYNSLLVVDQASFCPVSGSIETSTRVKVSKV